MTQAAPDSAPDRMARSAHLPGTAGAVDRLSQVRARLEAQRREVFAAIREYPTPITACDLQFNHLIEQRERIALALRELDALAAMDAADGAPALARLVRGTRDLLDEAPPV